MSEKRTFEKLLADIDQMLEQYQQRKPLSEDERTARYTQLRLKWTYNSNALEGNTLTLGETAFYLREGLTSEGKPLADYLEARNHAEAIDWLQQFVKRTRPVSEGFIKDLNALLHKGITERPAQTSDGRQIMRSITPGKYKQQPNHVLTLSGEVHYYVEPEQVPGEMERLVKLIEKGETGESHAVQLAADAHYEITRIHPFDDCNGRVARILLNLILMRAGYPPIVIAVEKRREYLECLEKADAGNRDPFYTFIAEHVKDALR